jgi:hypothetical protein
MKGDQAMPDIRYVCLSDMHLGADNSVLTTIQLNNGVTTDPAVTSPVLSLFVACLRELIRHNESPQKPTLVLNGDILELALTDTNKAAMVFERFIELVFPPEGEALFDKNILYLPGNHDHHIWESARETLYTQFIASVPTGSELPALWHTTPMFKPNLVPETFLTTLLRRYPRLKDASLSVIYPNYALANEQRCVIFNHGHYVEPIYSLMTTLNTMFFPDRKRPTLIWELEAENFAWIDFFWSTMGRSGDVGTDIGLFYDKLQDPRQFERLVGNFVTSFIEQKRKGKWFQSVEVGALKWLLDAVLTHIMDMEKHRTQEALSANARQGLTFYMEQPVREQLRMELGQGQSIPQDITFLFGHTHKPFQEEMTFAGYPAPIKVYNSGGWVVDKVLPSPIFGATVLLLDEALHTTSLHMYHQSSNDAEYAVTLGELLHPGETHSAFYERLCALVNPTSDPWKSFSSVVAEAVRVHEQALQIKIQAQL